MPDTEDIVKVNRFNIMDGLDDYQQIMKTQTLKCPYINPSDDFVTDIVKIKVISDSTPTFTCYLITLLFQILNLGHTRFKYNILNILEEEGARHK